ncbi:MAG: hypothetical protein KAS57_07270 [Gammaproteobacteria bacterium]|nr:hypothetical protein [Gammaproteobacteria bacterium]
MTHSNQIEKTIDRRASSVDRRMASERRSEERLSQMKGECRSSIPRRDMDINREMIEGEMWWSRQQFF